MSARVGVRLWWGLLLLLLLAWGLGLLVAPVIEGLPSPPWITGPGVLIGRYARDVAAAVTVGCLVVGSLLVDSAPVRRWVLRWGSVWLVVVAVLGLLTFSEVYAVSPIQSIGALWTFLVGTSIGQVFGAQILLILGMLACLPWASRRVVAWCAVVLALSAAMAPAFLGHGGLTGGHASATISLALHLGGVMLWVGGLAACLALLLIKPDVGTRLMPRFSVLALWCVIVVGETGLVNASLRVGTPDLFVGTLYGALVLCKATLLGWLIWFGWTQRRRALPALTNGPGAVLRYGGWELAVMGATLACAVLLSRIGPPNGGFTAGSFEPLAVLALALGLPLLLAWTVKPPRLMQRLANSPEIPVVSLLVVIALIAGLNVPARLLGVQLGVIVGSVILVVVGWAAAVSLRGPRGLVGGIMMMVGWPIVAVLVAVLAQGGPAASGTVVQIAVAEAILAGMLVIRRMLKVSEPSLGGDTHVGPR